MSFWSTDFMNDRRKQWLNALVKFQYLVNGTWYDATINTKRVIGNKVESSSVSENIERLTDN